MDGVLQMASTGRVIEAKDFPTAVFTPTVLQVAMALGLIGVGLIASLLVARLGGSEDRSGTPAAQDLDG